MLFTNGGFIIKGHYAKHSFLLRHCFTSGPQCRGRPFGHDLSKSEESECGSIICVRCVWVIQVLWGYKGVAY